MGVQIGEKRAKEIALLCRRYSAERAYEMGLVNEVVDDDALEESVRAVCREFEALSPRYLEIAKTSSNIWWNAARDSFSNGLGMLIQAIGSPDMVEGAQAFLEKRRPNFHPRSNKRVASIDDYGYSDSHHEPSHPARTEENA